MRGGPAGAGEGCPPQVRSGGRGPTLEAAAHARQPLLLPPPAAPQPPTSGCHPQLRSTHTCSRARGEAIHTPDNELLPLNCPLPPREPHLNPTPRGPHLDPTPPTPPHRSRTQAAPQSSSAHPRPSSPGGAELAAWWWWLVLVGGTVASQRTGAAQGVLRPPRAC